MPYFRVAARALRPHVRRMRGVASGTGELSLRRNETTALRKIHGLMAHVPGIVPIRRRARRGRHPVAGAALFIHLASAHAAEIPDVALRWRGGVLRAWSMTRLAANACFKRLDRTFRGDPKRARRVAGKATQDRGVGRECPVPLPAGIGVTWRQRELPRPPVVAESMLEICVLIRMADVRHGLHARAERPISFHARAVRGCQR